MVRSDPLPRAWHVAAKLVLSEKIVYGKDAKAIYPLQTLQFAISVGQIEIDNCNWLRVLMQEGNVKNESQFLFHCSISFKIMILIKQDVNKLNFPHVNLDS